MDRDSAPDGPDRRHLRKPGKTSSSPSADLVESAREGLKRSSSRDLVTSARRGLRRSRSDTSSQLARSREEMRRQLEESRRRVERKQAEREAARAAAPVPVAVEPVRTARPGPPPSRPVRAPVEFRGPAPERTSGSPVVAILAGLLAAGVGVALLLGTVVARRGGDGQETVTSPPATTQLPAVVTVADMIDAVIDLGYYVDPGIQDPDGRLAAAVDRAAAAGIEFAAVVLVDDRAEGALTIASEIEETLDEGTVLVLTATRAGISSAVFDDATLDRALDAGSTAFTEGGDPGYVEAVVKVLLGGR